MILIVHLRLNTITLPPSECMQAYVRFLKQHAQSRSKDAEAVRKLQIDNEIRSIKLQRLAGELVPVERVQQDWFNCGRRVRDGLLNLPSRLSGPFAAESNQDKIFESFTKEIHTTLSELSSRQLPTLAVGVPVEESTKLERSPDEREPRAKTVDCDVGAHTDLDGEAEQPEDRFPTGD